MRRAAARFAAAGALTLASAGGALAADGWTFAISPYAWLPGVSTSAQLAGRNVDVEQSSSDALSSLDFAFMGAAEARNGRWGLILDVIYSDLSASQGTPFGLLWSKAEVETKLAATTIYAAYRLVDHPRGSLDLLGGARFFALDLTVSLEPGRAAGASRNFDADWTDPVFGLRGRYALNEKWFATALADAGGFGGGSDETWQVFASVGYQFDARWSAEGGWRYMAIERAIDGEDVTIDLSGPMIGLTYRF